MKGEVLSNGSHSLSGERDAFVYAEDDTVYGGRRR